ncbi:MAG: MATE family efflux transporter [Epulopiscium sp. Nele67-Bin002]|nr:MAG: MATE family efflux transporter [Epulopiscium sp. Nele67-Bin001]OON91764.1 MAG: MATE family efflux transporter [Epulopiscium sp. Nele67-Bin002]
MQKIDLTKGNVVPVLISLALPVMGGSVLQFGYSLIDMLWVGRLGTNAVASVGSSSFFMGLGYAINALVVVGTGIKVSHKVGEGNETAARGYINAGLILNLIISLIYCSILFGFSHRFIGFLDLNNEIVEQQSNLYLKWSAVALFFIFLNTLFARIFGSYGNNKEVLKLSGIGTIVNIILDPVLIYGARLGVCGAAIATLIASIVTSILYLVRGRAIINYDKTVKASFENFKEICRLGFPMAFQRILFTLVNIMLAKIIASFGAEAIAAQKIGLQVESVMLMVIGGLNGAMASFTGQNFGAKKYDRMLKGYNIAIAMGISYAIVTGVLFWIFPQQIGALFVSDELTIAITVGYLKVIAVTLAFAAVEMISNGFFAGLGQPKVSAIISITFTILRLPIALLLTSYYGIYGVWLSIAITSALKGISARSYYEIKIKRSIST